MWEEVLFTPDHVSRVSAAANQTGEKIAFFAIL
jgi:hypothetical protein